MFHVVSRILERAPLRFVVETGSNGSAPICPGLETGIRH